jgi:transcriptional regulator with XRE-family HTH domain
MDDVIAMPDPDLRDVGRRIKAARLKKSWKQHQLAAVVGVATQTINRYETGARNIQADMIIKVAAALDVPAGEFFPDGDGLTADEREMIGYLRANPQHRGVVLSTLRSLQDMANDITPSGQ